MVLMVDLEAVAVVQPLQLEVLLPLAKVMLEVLAQAQVILAVVAVEVLVL
jgi:hypothetical protein